MASERAGCSDRVDAKFAADFLERLRSAIAARSVDAVLELATDDVIYDDSGPDAALHGKDELAELFRPIFSRMSSTAVDLEDSYVGLDGTSVAARWHYRLTPRGKTEPISVHLAGFYKFRDGKVCRMTAFIRHLGWLGDVLP